MNLLEYLPKAVTMLFLLVTLSYYILLFIKKRRAYPQMHFSSITIIIPTHNEEDYIKECIYSVVSADFKGKKEIIVVDDGSTDRTADIVAGHFPNVKLIRKKHTGKADSINKAISISKGKLIAVVDGDSYIHKDSLMELKKEVERKDVAAASCAVRVKNRRKFVCMWLELEQLYNSLIRQIFSKLNANIVTPGPLSIYRKKELLEVGGFSTKGFSEDIDVTIRLIRKGYKIGFSDKAITETNMPYDIKGFFRQRTRFARGIIYIFKQHLRLNKAVIDLYTLPLFLFMYAQAVIMGSFTVYQIASGYYSYFLAKGVIFDIFALKFLFEWFSIAGFVKWAISVFSGQTPLTLFALAGVFSTLLTYPLYFYAIKKYAKKPELLHIFALAFMFPFWLLVMIIYIICLPEYFRKKQHNIWKKNE